MIDLSLIGPLADRVVALLKRREEVRKTVLEQVINPAMTDLDRLHEQYVKRLLDYRRMAQDTDAELNLDHPMFSRMRQDELYQAAEEIRVAAIDEENSDPTVKAFLELVIAYLFDAATPPGGRKLEAIDFAYAKRNRSLRRSTMVIWESAERVIADADLQHSDDAKRELIVKAIDRTMASLQQKYSDIISMHRGLKSKFAMPR